MHKRLAPSPTVFLPALTHLTMLNTTFVVVQKKGCVTIPWHIRTKTGIDIGDMLDVSVKNGKIMFAPHKKAAAKSGASTRPAGATKTKRGKK
jgi:AbrB family looped-hinge helix DNA binding protein